MSSNRRANLSLVLMWANAVGMIATSAALHSRWRIAVSICCVVIALVVTLTDIYSWRKS